VDIGDIVQGADQYAKIKADFYSKALSLMKYDAVGVGETELRYFSESHTDKLYGDVPLICANVTTDSKKLFASKPYIVRQTSSGLKVGIIAVLGNQVVYPAIQQQAGMTVTPPEEMLAKQVAKVRKKADLVILLSHAGEQSRKFADIPGIDIILSGHSGGASMEAPEKIGDALYMITKSSGKYIGKLVLDIGADKKITGFAGEYVPLGKSYQDDPEMATLVTDQDKALEVYYAAMRAQVSRPSPGQPNAPHAPQPFVSANKCRECHASEHASWSNTGHARAFEALRKDNRQTDPDCVSCHTTGFKAKGGFTSEIVTPLLKGVQCEACHGPGVIHSRKPAKGYGLVLESACLQCHDRANSPTFDRKMYMAKIAHKKEASQ